MLRSSTELYDTTLSTAPCVALQNCTAVVPGTSNEQRSHPGKVTSVDAFANVVLGVNPEGVATVNVSVLECIVVPSAKPTHATPTHAEALVTAIFNPRASQTMELAQDCFAAFTEAAVTPDTHWDGAETSAKYTGVATGAINCVITVVVNVGAGSVNCIGTDTV